MSECVVRMKMPENCLKCPLHEFGGVCLLKVEHTAEEWLNIDKRRPLNCPILCQLPEGHGRLVDADATVNDIQNEILEFEMESNPTPAQHFWLMKNWIADEDICPTIVPAERSET